MAGPVLFSDLDVPNTYTSKKPFFALDLESDTELFTWLRDELAFLQQDNRERLEKIKNNYLRYKGIQYMQQVYVPRDIPETRKRYMPQITIPLIRSVVDEIVSRLLEFKPSIAVMPVNDEERDKSDAKIAKRFLSHVDYINQLDRKILTLTRDSKICGEAYLETSWDPDAGEQIGLRPPVTNQDGKTYQMPVYQGDVCHRNRSVFNTFYQKTRKFEDVDYVFFIDPEYTEGLKREYPDKSDLIKSDNVHYYDTEKLADEQLNGMTYKIRFFHRPTKYLPEGFEVCFTDLGILKKGQFPYKHKKLPFVRLVDQQNPEELHGESQMEFTKAMASQYNNLTNMIVKQQMLCSHPKWFVDAGSVDEQALGNDITIVKIKNGANKPVLAQANPVSPQIFDFRDKLKEEFYQLSKSNSVVQGDPPAGITAFVALQYVSEAESRRMSTDVQTLNAAIRDIYDITLQEAAQFYKPGEPRTMMILGPDAKWMTKKYDPQSLQGPYSIMVQNQTALPESRAVRTQFVLDMSKQYPDLFPKEQIIEMLGLGQGDKFMDLGSASARAAEEENEIILDEGKQIEPAEWEDHITHWKIHVMKIQDIGFKTVTDKARQDAMKLHIMATEMLMVDQATKSPQYAQQLLMLPMFPMFYVDQAASAAAGMLTGVLPKVMGGGAGMAGPVGPAPAPMSDIEANPSDIAQGIAPEPTANEPTTV